jgi:hypothetical protein
METLHALPKKGREAQLILPDKKTSGMGSLEGPALLSTATAHQGLLTLSKFASLAYTIGIAFVSSHERVALFFSTPGQSMVKLLLVDGCLASCDAKKRKAMTYETADE